MNSRRVVLLAVVAVGAVVVRVLAQLWAVEHYGVFMVLPW